MPRIDDQGLPKHRPFKKKPYRPWNLLDDEDILPTTNEREMAEEIGQDKVTNKEPISNQLVTNKEPESNHKVTNQPHKVTIKEPISNRYSNRFSNQLVTNKPDQNTVNISEKNASEDIQRVAGLQRKILFYIVEDCILRGELSSNPINTELLQKLTNADVDTLKTATQRLINKKLIRRGDGKRGRGGFAIFYITQAIRNAVIDVQKMSIINDQLVTIKEPIKVYSSSSSNNIINTTTTRELEKNFISSWEGIDIQPLNGIGFTRSHLQQIIMDDKLSSEIVQDSIYAFAFDLEKNNKESSLKSSPLNYFMGILRGGKPYAPPANYESPQEAAMRVYLERRKERESKRQAMDDELFQMAFKEWEAKLSFDEKENIYPSNVRNSRIVSEKTACLRLHFKDQIWPALKLKWLNENEYRED